METMTGCVSLSAVHWGLFYDRAVFEMPVFSLISPCSRVLRLNSVRMSETKAPTYLSCFASHTCSKATPSWMVSRVNSNPVLNKLRVFFFVRSGDPAFGDAALEETVSRKDDEIKSMEQRKKDVATRSRCVCVHGECA